MNRFVVFFAALAVCLAGCEAGSPAVVDPRAGVKTVGGEDPSFNNGFEAAPAQASETPSTSPEPAEVPPEIEPVLDNDPNDDWELCVKYKAFEGKWWTVEFENGYGFKYPANKGWFACTCTPVPEKTACNISCLGEAPADAGLPVKSGVFHTETYDPVWGTTTVTDQWEETTFEPCSNRVVPGHPDYEETCVVQRDYLNGNLDSEWWWSRAAAD
ncbi:MAG: hypothetical protein HYY51_01605 [Candidatus Magasanikbacteria bacterium]|nr:hypothetical protein [Candidatus Magasanikbacteria bacterium]